jgi:hypothetical protein
MRKEIEDACETIDAMVYSGDMLEFERERDDFKEYVEMWLEKIQEFEVEDEDGNN